MDCGQCWDCEADENCIAKKHEKTYKKVFKSSNGHFYDISHYDLIIDKDSDPHFLRGYKENGDLLYDVRFNNIKEGKEIYKNIIRQPAKSLTKNRGSGAGIVDLKKFPKGAVELCDAKGNPLDPDKEYFSVYYKYEDGRIVKRCQSNRVRCGVAGYFGKVGQLPCRMVSWSRDHLEKHKGLFPLCENIRKTYEDVSPDHLELLEERSFYRPQFRLGDTPFSTMTLNYDFRTANHKDKGDFDQVLSTLTIFEDKINNYKGFYLGLPDYKIAFDLRDGDTIYFDAHEYHANTECEILTNDLPIDSMTGNSFAGRMAVVLYLRENLIKCPDID